MIEQNEVRKKLIEKCKGLKIKYIAEQIGVPREILSKFKTGNRKELYPESLIALNEFLDNH